MLYHFHPGELPGGFHRGMEHQDQATMLELYNTAQQILFQCVLPVHLGGQEWGWQPVGIYPANV